jgi:nucleotide-binding universal stress UspA family protein
MAADPGDDAGAAPLAVGQLIDGFRLDAFLHQGGMAHLWAVTKLDTDGQPASDPGFPLIMKVPRIKGGEDPATIVGFEVEQMILPALEGPHVPRFVARGDFTGQPYIVMERIGGASLLPRLAKAPLPIDEVAGVGARVATALHALHRQRLVHLDVKPSNVMFRPDGTAVLVDFGLSRHDRLPDLLDEQLRLPIGTGPYMSPEQLRFVRNDPRSDIFALGVMLYHFTTGERPFGAPTNVRGLRRRLYTDPVPMRTHRPDCPPWLQEVVLQCLEVEPEKRWQSAAQLALALQHPLQVPLTERAERLRPSGMVARMKRRLGVIGADVRMNSEASGPPNAATQVMKSPIIMAAVDIDGAAPALLEQLCETVRRIVATEPGARLACVSVLRTGRVGVDQRVDDTGQSVHVKQLVGLKHWARPVVKALQLDEGRLTVHVLEGPDPAAAIVDFASRNQVDHIVMGARGNSALRRYLGSVSSQVVAQADCTVTVVRA